MDNYSKSVDNSIKPRLPPVDNSVISWIYETFSDHNVRPVYLSKLHGLSPTNPYVWIKPGYINLWLSGIVAISYTRHYDTGFTFPEFSDMM